MTVQSRAKRHSQGLYEQLLNQNFNILSKTKNAQLENISRLLTQNKLSLVTDRAH